MERRILLLRLSYRIGAVLDLSAALLAALVALFTCSYIISGRLKRAGSARTPPVR